MRGEFVGGRCPEFVGVVGQESLTVGEVADFLRFGGEPVGREEGKDLDCDERLD